MKAPNKVYTLGSSELLRFIWRKFGGPANITKIYLPQFPRQSYINWRERGNVPLKFVFTIAEKLNIPAWGLNYEELAVMMPTEIPSWTEVVNSYGLTKQEVNRVLYLKPPKGGTSAANEKRNKNNEKHGQAVRS